MLSTTACKWESCSDRQLLQFWIFATPLLLTNSRSKLCSSYMLFVDYNIVWEGMCIPDALAATLTRRPGCRKGRMWRGWFTTALMAALAAASCCSNSKKEPTCSSCITCTPSLSAFREEHTEESSQPSMAQTFNQTDMQVTIVHLPLAALLC